MAIANRADGPTSAAVNAELDPTLSHSVMFEESGWAGNATIPGCIAAQAAGCAVVDQERQAKLPALPRIFKEGTLI
jgi:hypothetical protein